MLHVNHGPRASIGAGLRPDSWTITFGAREGRPDGVVARCQPARMLHHPRLVTRKCCVGLREPPNRSSERVVIPRVSPNIHSLINWICGVLLCSDCHRPTEPSPDPWGKTAAEQAVGGLGDPVSPPKLGRQRRKPKVARFPLLAGPLPRFCSSRHDVA
jgi:hypothetical protein